MSAPRLRSRVWMREGPPDTLHVWEGSENCKSVLKVFRETFRQGQHGLPKVTNLASSLHTIMNPCGVVPEAMLMCRERADAPHATLPPHNKPGLSVHNNCPMLWFHLVVERK